MSEKEIKDLEEILKSDAETDSFFNLDYLASLCLQENKKLKEELELKSGMNIAVQNLKLIEENQQLKDKINTYENPEDLTLMFMYCDEKAKDKIKQLKEVIEEVRKTLINSKEYKMANAMNLNAKQSVLVELLQILDKAK